MDTQLIEPFVEATVNVLGSTFSLACKPGKVFELDQLAGHEWEISGTLGIVGPVKGIVVIRLGHDLVARLLELSGVHGGEGDERRETCEAMVGEMVNMIAGNAIGSLPFGDLDISPPMVVQGPGHRISWPRFAPVHSIPFDSAAGPFEVAVCIG